MKLSIIPVASDIGAPRRGTAFAAEALRVAGLGQRWAAAAWQSPLAPDAAKAAESGAAALVELASALAARTRQAVGEATLPLVIGGDHSIALGTWRGVAQARQRHGAVGLLWIDAHMDAHTSATTETGMLHGMPLAALFGEGDADLVGVGGAEAPRLAPAYVALVGVRSFEAGEAELLRRLGVAVFGMAEIDRRGLAAVMRDALAIVRAAPGGFGVSFDVDSLDPQEAPGVTVPEAHGLIGSEVAATLAGIAGDPRCVALEVVEYNPLNDVAMQSARLVIDIVASMFSQEDAMPTIIERERHHGANNYAPLPVVMTRGEGIYLWDEAGRRYMDMMSAYSAVSLGHAHPELVRVLAEQAARLSVISRAYYSDRLAPLYERLCALTGMDRVLPANTGLEAVEAALKAARKWGHKVKGIADGTAEIICCDGNFHGRSIAIVAMSSEAQYRDGFGPFPPGFVNIPFADAAALEAAITPRTAAFLVEPIQGEGGIIVPPDGYLREVAAICRRHNVMLILDEVQTGLGRTGKLFCWQHEGVRPDGLCLGKALGGGLLPVSAFVARRELMDVFKPGDHGSTFGGNPLAAAVAAKALDLIVDGRLAERAEVLGRRFMAGLAAIDSPLIREVRGKGLLIGLEVHRHLASARDLAERLLAHGLLTKETHGTVLRFAPPLIIDEAQVDAALTIVAEVFAEAGGAQRKAA
jgi:ornithine--oxo-acid transaminase